MAPNDDPVAWTNGLAVSPALKAIADSAPLRLISLVAAHQEQEACVCDLTEPVALSQPTTSSRGPELATRAS